MSARRCRCSSRPTLRSAAVGMIAPLRELAGGRGLLIGADLVSEDEGVSGAVLRRPGLSGYAVWRSRAGSSCCCVTRRIGLRAVTRIRIRCCCSRISSGRGDDCVALGAGCGAVCVLAARRTLFAMPISGRRLLAALASGTVVTAAMVAIALATATAVYALALQMDAPRLAASPNGPFGIPPTNRALAGQLIVMLAACALATVTTYRGWSALVQDKRQYSLTSHMWDARLDDLERHLNAMDNRDDDT